MTQYRYDFDANYGVAETVHEPNRPTYSPLLDQYGRPLRYEQRRIGFDLRKTTGKDGAQ